MTAATSALPPGFEALEPFVERWASADADQRAQQRRASSEDERVDFFEAAKGLVDTALAHLDGTPLNELDPAQKRLLNLLLAFTHVSLAVEMQREREPMLSEMSRHMPITRASADLDATEAG